MAGRAVLPGLSHQPLAGPRPSEGRGTRSSSGRCSIASIASSSFDSSPPTSLRRGRLAEFLDPLRQAIALGAERVGQALVGLRRALGEIRQRLRQDRGVGLGVGVPQTRTRVWQTRWCRPIPAESIA